jgi:hypothetical protein
MIRKGRVRWVGKGDPLAKMQFIDELFGLTLTLAILAETRAFSSFRNDTQYSLRRYPSIGSADNRQANPTKQVTESGIGTQ